MGRRVTLCVGGSIAAYKAALLARLLIVAGATVEPLMTRAAMRFLGAATLSGLTGRAVRSGLFGEIGEPHVQIAEQSDLIAVVPATADLMARLAHGRAGDLVSATLLCARCPVIIAPAMHPHMWSHPLTQENAERLRQLPNWQLLGPVFGEVASGERGVGRLMEPEQIAAAIESALHHVEALAGRHVVVSAGPTVEDWDPVRSLTNRSSGKMGFALAHAARARGARVTLVAGPVALSTPAGVQRVDVRSAMEMQAALAGALGAGPSGADALIMCAAVADYRPRARAASKLKRDGQPRTLELVPNPDILAEIGRARGGERPVLIGFAMETDAGEAELLERARGKLEDKRVDAIVANRAAEALGGDETRAYLVSREQVQELGPGPKSGVAGAIVDYVARRLAQVDAR